MFERRFLLVLESVSEFFPYLWLSFQPGGGPKVLYEPNIPSRAQLPRVLGLGRICLLAVPYDTAFAHARPRSNLFFGTTNPQ